MKTTYFYLFFFSLLFTKQGCNLFARKMRMNQETGTIIHIVVRPSDNGEVIVYYSSEKDTLDYANAELWIDNGRDAPSHLTLGRILKNTGINRIPV